MAFRPKCCVCGCFVGKDGAVDVETYECATVMHRSYCVKHKPTA